MTLIIDCERIALRKWFSSKKKKKEKKSKNSKKK